MDDVLIEVIVEDMYMGLFDSNNFLCAILVVGEVESVSSQNKVQQTKEKMKWGEMMYKSDNEFGWRMLCMKH